MLEPGPVDAQTLLSALPPVWPDATLREQIRRCRGQRNEVVVALDDDPTGTQTVHDVSILTSWAVCDLRLALQSGDLAVYVLTNSRGTDLRSAQAINREVARNLATAAREAGKAVTVVSRSDSTLRGHFPGEVDALADELELEGPGPFDAICIIPFFPEGGRLTVTDVHWVREDDRLVPAAQTPYAQDPVFGYGHSHLPAWVEEKTSGAVRAADVTTISIDDLRRSGPAAAARALLGAPRGGVVCVNAADYRDLEVFVRGVLTAENEGRRFLFRTAASFVKVAAGVADRDLLTAAEVVGDQAVGGGLTVVGSHVPKSTAQLAQLVSQEKTRSHELDVVRLMQPGGREAIVRRARAALDGPLSAGQDALLFTSRRVVRGSTKDEDLQISALVSSALVDVVGGLRIRPRYIVAKGGITASDLATEGMRVRSARVLGQILPGVPVWRLGEDTFWPGMPYVVFPGNVGDDQALVRVVRALSRSSAGAGEAQRGAAG